MKQAPPRKLLIPAPYSEPSRLRLRANFPPPPLPSWPWQATMLTAVNCYLLWAFSWIQFLTNLPAYYFSGQDLSFYSTTCEPFGLTVSESYIAYSFLLSGFCIAAVICGTWRTPHLWKRLLTVSIFAAITLGFSFAGLHLRHQYYLDVLAGRDYAQERYHRSLTLHYDSKDPWRIGELEWQERILLDYDAEIQKYEERYPNERVTR